MKAINVKVYVLMEHNYDESAVLDIVFNDDEIENTIQLWIDKDPKEHHHCNIEVFEFDKTLSVFN